MKSAPSAAPSATPYEPKLASAAAVIADATRARMLSYAGECALEVTPQGRKHLAGLLPSVNTL